jgi:NAD(P) transhydrogenase subunit alpha
MKYQIGLLKESEELRFVTLTPLGVSNLVDKFQIFVESGAGEAIGYTDEMYQNEGAIIIDNQQDLIFQSDFVLTFNKPIKNEYLNRKRSFVGFYNVLNDSAVIAPFTHTIADVYSLDLMPLTRGFNALILKRKITPVLYDAIIESSLEYFNQEVRLLPQVKKALIIESGHTSIESVQKLLSEGFQLTVVGNSTMNQIEFEKVGIAYHKLSHLEMCEPNVLSRTNEEERCLSEIALYLNDSAHLFDVIVTDFVLSGEKTPLLLQTTTYEKLKEGALVFDLSAPIFGNCTEIRSADSNFQLFTLTEMLNQQAMSVSDILSEIYSRFLEHFIDEKDENFDVLLNYIKVVENGKVINNTLIREVNEM